MVQFAEANASDNESVSGPPSTSTNTGLSDIDDSTNGSGSPRWTTTANGSRDEKKARRKRRRRRAKDGGISEVGLRPSSSKRRNSLSKAARDPRDEPERKRKKTSKREETETRSPSPVIDFDGLSRPSSCSSPVLCLPHPSMD